jgi:hypothetical protein
LEQESSGKAASIDLVIQVSSVGEDTKRRQFFCKLRIVSLRFSSPLSRKFFLQISNSTVEG